MERVTIVEVIDGSYSVVIKNGSLNCTGNICKGQRYILIATNCILPSNNKSEKNDTVMQDLDTGDILFAQSRFLRPVHTCNICPKCGKSF